jgi:hypothetical protein
MSVTTVTPWITVSHADTSDLLERLQEFVGVKGVLVEMCYRAGEIPFPADTTLTILASATDHRANGFLRLDFHNRRYLNVKTSERVCFDLGGFQVWTLERNHLVFYPFPAV